ncbi:hypothetical protein OHC33_004645 [Knufia fluminis]|uniref:Uncharacterized protein n=1 Tax=Knufia fluminis TaxID=191047 RepID=A0AAN8EEY9_9EURO|nr:hypothetical protein OHC33_004645 [Knufia fluminis]
MSTPSFTDLAYRPMPTLGHTVPAQSPVPKSAQPMTAPSSKGTAQLSKYDSTLLKCHAEAEAELKAQLWPLVAAKMQATLYIPDQLNPDDLQHLHSRLQSVVRRPASTHEAASQSKMTKSRKRKAKCPIDSTYPPSKKAKQHRFTLPTIPSAQQGSIRQASHDLLTPYQHRLVNRVRGLYPAITYEECYTRLVDSKWDLAVALRKIHEDNTGHRLIV